MPGPVGPVQPALVRSGASVLRGRLGQIMRSDAGAVAATIPQRGLLDLIYLKFYLN